MKVIKFSATWCGPCKVFANTFSNIKNKYADKGIEFLSYDVDEDDEGIELSQTFGIRGVPSVVILDDEGKEISRIVGNVPQKTFEEKMEELLK